MTASGRNQRRFFFAASLAVLAGLVLGLDGAVVVTLSILAMEVERHCS